MTCNHNSTKYKNIAQYAIFCFYCNCNIIAGHIRI